MKYALNTSTNEIDYLVGNENTALMRRSSTVWVHTETYERMTPCAGAGTMLEAFFRLERGSDARYDTLSAQTVANRRYARY